MKRPKPVFVFTFFVAAILCALCCQSPAHQSDATLAISVDSTAIASVLIPPDSAVDMPFLSARIAATNAALRSPIPVLTCTDSLNSEQQLAQIIALSDSAFTSFVHPAGPSQPLRNEIFGVYPARQSDVTTLPSTISLAHVYRVEMYNYALNLSSYAIVDVAHQQVLLSFHQPQSQPDIPRSLQQIAVKIAAASPAVQEALGFTPGQSDALMSSTKTSLNHTRCERSHHLCVAPTFLKNGKALWAIVDLTDLRLSGIRWTNVGETGQAAPLTEKRLQDDKLTACFCELEQPLARNGWELKYMLTSSDGLRVSNVNFNGKPVLRSAKLVDWHVSYSGVDGFGYSDAVGCPNFSQAAVIAWEPPKVMDLLDDHNQRIGFVLEQVFRSEGWPTPCAYNYRQRYEFYDDGKFRVSCASIGRGCGNDGTYRPVFRIAFAGDDRKFSNWTGSTWNAWTKEQWMEQTTMSRYTPEGYLYRIDGSQGDYYIKPGNGNFGDGGRGDFSYLYITRHDAAKDEGENDLVTIGPCCNTDYHQGPEKFIEPVPDEISNASLVIWYVAQLKNDDRKGNEYCWAESVLEHGVYKTRTYPCFCGPMFIPVKIKP